MLSQMSDPNFFWSDKVPKWSVIVGMLTIISNTGAVQRNLSDLNTLGTCESVQFREAFRLVRLYTVHT